MSLPLSAEAVSILGACLGVFTSTQPWTQQIIENLGHQSRVRTAQGGALASSSTVETSDCCPHLPLLPSCASACHGTTKATSLGKVTVHRELLLGPPS